MAEMSCRFASSMSVLNLAPIVLRVWASSGSLPPAGAAAADTAASAVRVKAAVANILSMVDILCARSTGLSLLLRGLCGTPEGAGIDAIGIALDHRVVEL